jgi:predicted  nucleic acid-binding Zn-ribbon protein
MLSPLIEKLLILQDRDSRRLGIEAQLKAIPREIAGVEQKIVADRAAIEAARTELKDLEVAKKALETEIGVAEQKLAKYRTQQLSVRKNDEYQALGHEIETVQGQIGGLEGQELETMYKIDEARKRFASVESSLKLEISGHENRIRTLQEWQKNLTEELKSAQAETAVAREPLTPSALRTYDRAGSRGMPAVVPIRGAKCGGCHLKVSSGTESAARGKDPDAEFALCDQCGRMVYWES